MLMVTLIIAIALGMDTNGSVDSHRQTQEEHTRSQSQTARYHDARERMAASMTFEWTGEGGRIYQKRFLSRLAEPDTPPPSSDSDVIEYDAEHLQIQGLRSTYRIECTPKLTRISASKEIPTLAKDRVWKSEEPFRWTNYYLGETGEIIISTLDNSGSQTSVVHIGLGGHNGIGLPSPFLGEPPEFLVFLGGISPFRLYGFGLESWRLVEVNETTWVFELQPDEEKRKSLTGYLSFGQIRVHLSRKHGDAPAQLEIHYRDGHYSKWTTLEYKQIQGVWFPSQVLREYTESNKTGWHVYTLQSTRTSVPVVVEIADGAPVLDWSLEGLKLWLAKSSCKPLETQWSAELLRSLWQRIGRPQKSAEEKPSNPANDGQ